MAIRGSVGFLHRYCPLSPCCVAHCASSQNATVMKPVALPRPRSHALGENSLAKGGSANPRSGWKLQECTQGKLQTSGGGESLSTEIGRFLEEVPGTTMGKRRGRGRWWVPSMLGEGVCP